MPETLGGFRESELILSENEIAKRNRDYKRVLRRLSPEQQGVITELISALNEWDIYQQYRGNVEKIEDLSTSLNLIGLKRNQRRVILRYLNLS